MTDSTASHGEQTTQRSIPDGLPIDSEDDLEYAERSHVHDDAEYCASDTDGRAIVGVTNDDGEVLLLVNDEREHAILPNCHVEDGDWTGVAGSTVENSTGIPIDLLGPELVRRVEHRVEGDEDSREVTHHVAFRATPEDTASDGEGDPEPTCDDEDWRAGWYDEIPVAMDEAESGDVIADVERFLE